MPPVNYIDGMETKNIYKLQEVNQDNINWFKRYYLVPGRRVKITWFDNQFSRIIHGLSLLGEKNCPKSVLKHWCYGLTMFSDSFSFI